MTIVGDPWGEAAALATLHTHRSQDELESQFARELRRLVPEVDMALCLADDARGAQRLQFAIGDRCPLRAGEPVLPDAWPVPPAQRLPIRFRSHVLGELMVGRALREHERAVLVAALVHYGAALVNLTLNEESRQATENYCASLQALEEGIILFQEEDAEAVIARLLSLATGMVRAAAGALYVLREVGNPTSGLQLEQVTGMPESLLASFVSVDGSPWPDVLLGQAARFEGRNDDGSMAMLAPGCVPSVLTNVVVMPLRYHGVEAGVCLLLNPAVDAANSRDYLTRVQSLGQLGAALLHRLRLEALTAQNRSIQREMQIAATIQQRLLPTAAPATDEYEFAWCSIAAQSIGGDLLDLLTSTAGDTYAVVADASGHGINSALLMSSFRSTYRANVAGHEPAALAAILNEATVHEVGPTGMFITAVLVRLEQGTRRMTVSSAGHNATLVFRSRTGMVERIDADGPPLGFVAQTEFGACTTQLEPGDVVLLYTDGITEAANDELDMFGEDLLAKILGEHAAAGAEAVLAAARTGLREFTGREHYEDDVSLSVIKAR